MPTIREIQYSADGLRLVGRLAVPDGSGPFPGVLIAHEGPGLDDFQRSKADRLAGLGFVALALDYHGELSPFKDRDLMMERLTGLIADPDRTRALAAAGLNVLLAEATVDPTKIAAIGYCFGGTMALELARSGADVKAIVGFHPGLSSTRPEDNKNIRGRVLMCVGSDDLIVPVDQRTGFETEMRAAGIDWQMHTYGGVMHSFTHPGASQAGLPGIAYDETADKRSWRSMLDLFAEVFGPR